MVIEAPADFKGLEVKHADRSRTDDGHRSLLIVGLT